MKKQKLKNYIKLGVLLLGISSLFWNCETDGIDKIEEQKNIIETVSIDEVFNLFSSNWSSNLAKATNDGYTTTVLANQISQEEILCRSELLIVIPASTIYSQHYSRILLLKINGDIKSVVYSMFPNENSTNESFSGEIVITDLKGNFLNGYRVNKGTFVSQFKRLNTSSSKNSFVYRSSGAVCPDHGECTEGSNCIICTQELEEVVVTGNSGNSNIPIVWLFDFTGTGTNDGAGDGPDYVMGWNDGSSGGGGSSNSANWEENIQQRNILCGSYNFTTAGDAAVVNISGLGMSVRKGYISIDAEFSSPLCVTIPYTIPAHASALFNSAWNVTMTEVYTYLNATYTITAPTPEVLKSLIQEFLLTNLNTLQPNSSISNNGCSGNIPTSPASYCP